jgi:hypothetical protein
MNVEITETAPAAVSASCIATGGERIFSRDCRSCTAFALDCFPPLAQPKAPRDREPATIIPADDLQATQRNCASSPCLSTGEARTFGGACRSCPAFGLWCFPAPLTVA